MHSEGNFFLIVKNKYFLNKHCVVISGEHTVASDMGDFCVGLRLNKQLMYFSIANI